MDAPPRDTLRPHVGPIALVLLALVAGCARRQPPPAQPAAAGRASVAVADFDFFSNDASLSYLRKGVPAMMCTDIAQVRALDVLARKAMLAEILAEQQLAEDGLIDRATAARAGKLLGAAFLLGGAVHVDEHRLRFDAQVVAVETGRVLFSATVTGPKEEAAALETQLAEQVAESICASIGAEFSESERLAVRGERKGGFDAFALYSKAAIAERAGETEKARQIFTDVMARHADPADAGATVAATLRAAASGATPAPGPDADATASRASRLARHKATWEGHDAGAARDARWLASPIILSVHAGLAGDFATERRLLGDYWHRFTGHVPVADATAAAKEIAGLIRAEEEFFRATVDSGVYSTLSGSDGRARNLHPDVGPDVHWPRFSRLWPFDDTLRMLHSTAQHAGGIAAAMVQGSFMARLPMAPHDYLEHAVDLDNVVESLHPEAGRYPQAKRFRQYPLLCGETLALRGDMIAYCSRIPDPPAKTVTDVQSLQFWFLEGLDDIPATVEPAMLGGDFLARTVPVLDALTKTAAKRDHRDLAVRLLARFGRRVALAGEDGAGAGPAPGKPAALFGVPVTTSLVLIVWHEDQLIDLDAHRQEDMAEKELADFVMALPASTAVNMLLAVGQNVAAGDDDEDAWLLEAPAAADAETKKRLLQALDPDARKPSAKGSLANAVRAALEASGGHDSTVIVVRLRDRSQIGRPLDASLVEPRPGVTVHAVLASESSDLAAFVRGHRGSMILLEKEEDSFLADVRKRVVDTAKE